MTQDVCGLSSVPIKGPWEAVHIALRVILDNALKFTDPGGKVSCQIQADRTDDFSDEVTVTISVTDSGIGINEDQLKNIFKPFVQLEHFLTRRYSGAGVGLAIVEGLCEKLGGNITVESNPGIGSRFCCSFKFRLLPDSIHPGL